MADLPAPPVPRVLLEYLERLFPNAVPDIGDSDREIGAKIGEQRVMKKLRHEFNRQNKVVETT